MNLQSCSRITVHAAASVLTLLCVVPSLSHAAASAPSPTSVSAALQRDVLFTEDWKFFLGDDAKAKDLDFDDSAWRTLDLPHDWSVESAFDPKLASCTAFLPCGTGWYRKTFTVAAEAKDKLISIRFDGVMNHATVWCNGKKVGERPYGYSSFTCDLTPAIRFGERNVVAVRVDHKQYGDSRWYAGSGIYRNVYLSVTGKVHIDDYGVFVTTPKVSADAADVNVQTVWKNEGPAVKTNLVIAVIDDKGRELYKTVESDSMSGGERAQSKTTANVVRPSLWSPDHPSMYKIRVEVQQGGATIDRVETSFGIRTFTFDPAKGFSLNGQPTKLKGVCLHHDAGALGAAVPIQVWERRLKLLKEAGCNAIRCSHNPPAPEFLDLCDRMGFLVMDEAFDEWSRGKKKWLVGHDVGRPGTDGYHSDFDRWADIDIRDMVLRDRNHPSIILWSIGNEIDFANDPYPPNSDDLPPIAERLIKDVKAVDTTRPVTAACAAPATNLYKKLLDVEGYNYMERLYTDDHLAHPARVIFGSENNHSLAAWQSVEANDYIAGQFLWTGIDYLGEAGVWPSHASGAGLLDLAGLPKNQYYFRKSLWSEEPMVYLTSFGPGRRRSRAAAGGGSVWCYTNCDSVELFRDGHSLGSNPQTPSHVVTWSLDSSGSTLKAVGTRKGKQVVFELKKPGDAAKLALLPDVASLAADGRDVAQIELNVVDKDGTLVPSAGNRIECTLAGPARIIGLENGNTSSTENYKSLSRTAYQGRLMIYVQSLKTAGEAKLTVSSPNLESVTVTLPVR